VAFHWAEAEPALGGAVPPEVVRRWDAHRVALRGTDQREPHCAQLLGTVGREVRCAIYLQRPSPCRELRAAWEDGAASEQCDRARARFGLRPLHPGDWHR
jgi:Fe-S-cluster containining protein